MIDNIFADARRRVLLALERVAPGLPADVLARVEVTPTRDASHGDMATNAAMVSAKAAQQKPAVLAALLAEALPDAVIARATPAGPGFVNLALHEDALRAIVPVILRAGEAFGSSDTGRASPSTSSTCLPTPPARCMSAIAGAPWWATRSPTC